ncbi:MAG TPA: hypothetical protein VGV61_02830, partial [Thermoanaerobaculia bacterium]|nr:hypothetical protein [Thermoanaerobaculia bacterium]
MDGFNACLDKVLPSTGVTVVCVLALTVVYLVSLAVVFRVERDQSALVRAQLGEARVRTDAAWDRLCDAFLVPAQRPHRVRFLIRLAFDFWREYRAWKTILPIGWWDLQALKTF